MAIVPTFAHAQTEDEIVELFHASASQIMLQYDLVRGVQCSRITALELYLFHPQIWPDTSTDKKHVQSRAACWYVRADRFASQWRIDIALGPIRSADGVFAYGGLLIAALDTEDGSGNAVKKILHGDTRPGDWQFGNKNSPEFELLQRQVHNLPVDSADAYLRLKLRKLPHEGEVWAGRRKGLGRSASLHERYKGARLRTAVHPNCSDWRSTLELGMEPLLKNQLVRPDGR